MADSDPTVGLDPDLWARAQEIYLEAAERTAAERATYLDEVCVGHSELRREVEELLAAAAEAHRIDEAVRDALVLLSDSEEEVAEARIGAYRLREEIGRGGMGVVYLAERADEHYQQTVAIKRVSRGYANRELLDRLRQERQILAHLQHPNIARLLDGGNTEDGSPYFVMEHIDGRPIDAYCDTEKLDLEPRLRLFLEVCEAVQHAHRNLVIHRDLKPSNILVTEDGRPQLLDFGIAKILGPDLGSDLLGSDLLGSGRLGSDLLGPDPGQTTRTGLRPLTPRYASPEQFRNDPLTTASDVYSLGVVLFELLTGVPPFSGSPIELEHSVLESEAPRPSAVARDQSWRRRLEGDLDLIVRKTLCKEPERRYGSVEHLADDIRRFLEGMPIRARPATFFYVARRFLARHRAAVASGLVVLTLVIGLTVFYTLRLAGEVEKRATVADFLSSLFRASHPNVAQGRSLSARDLLDDGAERLNRELEGLPELRSELGDTIGTAYLGLGDFTEARQLFEAALGERRGRLGEEHSEVAVSLKHLGDLAHAQSQFQQAEQHFRRALAIRREAFGDGHPLVAESRHDLGSSLFGQNRYEEAESEFRASLTIYRASLPVDDPRIAASLDALGVNLVFLGNPQVAEPLIREALQLRREAYGEFHLDVSNSLNNLAMAVAAQERLEEAEALQRQGRAADVEILPELHPRHVENLQNLAAFVLDQERFAEAGDLLDQALGLHHRLESPEALNAAALWELRSRAYLGVGDGEHASLAMQRSLDHARQVGDEGRSAAWRLLQLGRLEVDLGSERCAGSLEESLDLHRQLGEPKAWVAEVEAELGGCLVLLERFEEARPLLQQAYATLREALEPHHRKVLRVESHLCRLAKESGEMHDAERYCAENRS